MINRDVEFLKLRKKYQHTSVFYAQCVEEQKEILESDFCPWIGHDKSKFIIGLTKTSYERQLNKNENNS